MKPASARSQRALIWGGLILVVIFGVGYLLMGFWPPPPATLEPAQIVDLYARHNTQFRLGVVLCLFSGAFLLPWSLPVSAQMARLEPGMPIWAIFQFAAAALASILLWFPPILWGVAAFSVNRDSTLTVMMHEFGWLTFITPVVVFPMQLVAVAVVSLSKKEDDKYSAFPRWIGYLTLWQMVQSFGGLFAQMFKTGPFAWNGLFAFYLPVILFGVWTVALSFTMLRAIRHQETEAQA